jgi:sulfotransferase family protein
VKAPERVVYIAGVARSGTSWIGQIINSSPRVCFRFQPLFAYEFKGRVDEDSDQATYERLFRDIFNTSSPFLIQGDKQASGEYPKFEKNADPDILVFKENRYQSVLEPMIRRVLFLQAVGIVRHPCAVLNSWRHNSKEFPPGSEILKEWRFGNCKNKGNEDYFGYYKWKEIANLYLDLRDKYPDRFALLRYEDAVHTPQQTIPALFEFLKIPFEEASQRFLLDSTAAHDGSYYSVYKDKSVADKWRKELDAHIIDEIHADLAGTRLEQFLGDDRSGGLPQAPTEASSLFP